MDSIFGSYVYQMNFRNWIIPISRFVPIKLRNFFIFWSLLAWLVLLLSPKALGAEVDEKALWSLQFKSVSLSAALKQITQITGIKIILPSQLGNKVITESYKNQTIEHILKDIFKDMNYALVWFYGEKGIDSIRILVLEGVGAAGVRYSRDGVRPNIRDYLAPRYPAQGQSPPIPPPRRSMMDSEPEDTDSEISAEPQQEADDQAEAETKDKNEKSISSSRDLDEEEAPLPSKKIPERSDEDVEKDSDETPSIVEQNEEGESDSSSPSENESPIKNR